MRRIVAAGAIGALLSLTMAMATAGPAAASTACPPSKTGATIYDDIEVPANALCSLVNSTVYGNVQVDPGGVLGATGTQFYQSVVANQPQGVSLRNSTVYGNVTITGQTGMSVVCGSTILGSLTYQNSGDGSAFAVGGTSQAFLSNGASHVSTCSGSRGDTIYGSTVFSNNAGNFSLGGSAVYGSVVASGNTGGGTMDADTAYGSISCSGDTPAVSATGSNAFGGNNCPHVVETVTVPSDTNGSIVSSTNSLTNGGHYLLNAIGTVQISGSPDFRRGDAEYFMGFGNLENCASGDELGIVVNPAAAGASLCLPGSPLWGPFSPAHRYTRSFTGTGAPVTFNLSDNFYPDNSGSLTVQILSS